MLDLSTGLLPSIVMDCQPYNLKGVMSRDHTKHTHLKQRKVHILQQLAEVLALLHNCGPKVHHCDVKPDNILLSESLDVKLTDFGLSEERKVFYVRRICFCSHDLLILPFQVRGPSCWL